MKLDAVREFVYRILEESGLNRLPVELGGGKIFSSPLLGVSRGDDPIHLKLKEVVHAEHLAPEEMFPGSRKGMHFPPASLSLLLGRTG